jgi:hypothetical protein
MLELVWDAERSSSEIAAAVGLSASEGAPRRRSGARALSDGPLIIQAIRRDLSRSDGIDAASNVSRLDLSGAVQSDADHPPRNGVGRRFESLLGLQTEGQSTDEAASSAALLAR